MFKINEAERFKFFRVPKVLFEARYKNLSTDAKILYSLLFERMELSRKNGWHDDDGSVYIYFTLEEVCEVLGCGHDKATKLFCELENYSLLRRRKQGCGKPAKLYVLKFYDECDNSEVLNAGLPQSDMVNIGSTACGFSAGNNTDINNNYISNTNLSISRYDADATEQRIKEQLEYDILITKIGKDTAGEIVMLITDVICGTSETVRIGKSEFPREVVRSRFFKLNCEHIEYVVDCMKENTTDVRNIRSYLLTALYNAPATIDNHYRAKVNHDLYGN
jgi:hypothetical protein